AGGQQTYLPITDGRRLAEITGFRRLFGVKVLPVAAGVPFGLTIGNLAGWIPLPARLSIEVLDPVDVRRFRDLGDAYRHVTGVMQATLTRLTDGL
ncbi:MAG TPA: glycerol acyltransferase, partial [Acidimicrobiia bacterium]|nr:glycerol acyltransferase [Acidimicrobiia bacterium]